MKIISSVRYSISLRRYFRPLFVIPANAGAPARTEVRSGGQASPCSLIGPRFDQGQVMITFVLIIAGAIMGIMTLVSYVVISQLRQVTDAKSSASAFLAADQGIECVLMRQSKEAEGAEIKTSDSCPAPENPGKIEDSSGNKIGDFHFRQLLDAVACKRPDCTTWLSSGSDVMGRATRTLKLTLSSGLGSKTIRPASFTLITGASHGFGASTYGPLAGYSCFFSGSLICLGGGARSSMHDIDGTNAQSMLNVCGYPNGYWMTTCGMYNTYGGDERRKACDDCKISAVNNYEYFSLVFNPVTNELTWYNSDGGATSVSCTASGSCTYGGTITSESSYCTAGSGSYTRSTCPKSAQWVIRYNSQTKPDVPPPCVDATTINASIHYCPPAGSSCVYSSSTGKIYCVTGGTASAYDYFTEQASYVASLAGSYSSCAAAPDGKIYCLMSSALSVSVAVLDPGGE